MAVGILVEEEIVAEKQDGAGAPGNGAAGVVAFDIDIERSAMARPWETQGPL